MIGDHAADAADDGLEVFRGTQAIERSLGGVAFHLLFDAGDADLEELIEVRADDAEELQPFEQAIVRIERLVEHALVEFQPAQFAIEEVLRFESVDVHNVSG